MTPAKSIFLLVGDEKFLKEEWLSGIKQRFFKSANTSAADFNLFFAKDIDLSGVLSIARTRPFLGSKRLIVIKNIELLNSPLHREQLLNYAKSPSLDAALVLEADIKEKDFLEDRFLSEIGKFSQVLTFKKLYDANLYNWISKRCILRKKRIESQAIELLKQLKGNDLKNIDEEIEKLSLYVAPRNLITEGDVCQLVGKDITGTVYDMVDAISKSDRNKVLALSLDFQKKDLANSIGLFCWNLRLLLRVKGYLNEGNTAQRIGDRLGLKKFQLEKVVNQAGRLNSSWLKLALSELAEFDLKIKTSGFCDSFLGWQMLLVRLVAEV